MSFTYGVKEKAESPFDTVIEKGNITVEFTPSQMIQEQVECQKFIKEIEGNIMVQEAKMTNILEHHPFVKDMSEQDRFTVHMFQEAYAFVQGAKNKVHDLSKQLEASRMELVHIAKELNLPVDMDVKVAVAEDATKKITG